MNRQPKATSARAGRAWNPWPVSIIGFFILAVIGCATFIGFCSRHAADLVAADYYEQEVRYQTQIERSQRGELAAHLAIVRYDPASKRIVIALPPGPSWINAAGKIQFYRPSAAAQDRTFELAPDASGLQTIDAVALMPGLWKVRVSWSSSNQESCFEQKVVIGEPGHRTAM